jgi:hypothetical protein
MIPSVTCFALGYLLFIDARYQAFDWPISREGIVHFFNSPFILLLYTSRFQYWHSSTEAN